MAEFKEYPKVIHCGGGTFTVQSAEEEAQYRAGDANACVPPQPVHPDDLPAYNAPKAKVAPKAKQGDKKK